MEEEEAGVAYLVARLERAEAEVLEFRKQFQKIERLCHDATDTYYTMKIIQKMVEETNRLLNQKGKP